MWWPCIDMTDVSLKRAIPAIVRFLTSRYRLISSDTREPDMGMARLSLYGVVGAAQRKLTVTNLCGQFTAA